MIWYIPVDPSTWSGPVHIVLSSMSFKATQEKLIADTYSLCNQQTWASVSKLYIELYIFRIVFFMRPNFSSVEIMFVIPTARVFKCGTICLLPPTESRLRKVSGIASWMYWLHDPIATQATRACSLASIWSLTKRLTISCTTLCKRMLTSSSFSISNKEDPWIWMPMSSSSNSSSAFTT